ncbi:MAG: triose-phosphate isomerase [Candidatus Thermoplasmatota archaeon]|nr:triose-phosphate isomerase [Candidatus Thermoplasmatota archaeon]
MKKMRTPVIVINFKAYTEIIGRKGLELAKLCEKISYENEVEIAIAPQNVDLGLIAKEVKIPVLAQHVDAIEPGSKTGHITCEAIKAVGAKGTLINHSEKRLLLADIEFIVKKCKALELISVVCTNNLEVSKACSLLAPDFIAIEPPELIGGEIAVTTADPEIVRGAVTEIKKLNSKVSVLCGAGIKNGKDVAKALELGTSGVLLASGIIKAKDQRKALEDLVSGMK